MHSSNGRTGSRPSSSLDRRRRMAVGYNAAREFARRRIPVFSVIRDGLLHGLTFGRLSSSFSPTECFYTRLPLSAYTFRADLFLKVVLLLDSMIARWMAVDIEQAQHCFRPGPLCLNYRGSFRFDQGSTYLPSVVQPTSGRAASPRTLGTCGLLGCRFGSRWLFTEFGQLHLDFVIPRYLLIEEAF